MSIIVYCLAFIFGVLGKGVVIWLTGFKMKKTVNTVWFLNLAVADFLFTALLPLTVTYTAMDFHWPLGNFMCKLNATITSLNMFTSVYILMVISVDRCVLFVVPFPVVVSCYTVIIHCLQRNRTLASQSSRSFKIIAAIIATFFLCWAPFHIIFLIELVYFTSINHSETLDYVLTIGFPIATSLIYLNSCLNPLLYVFMGQDFKDKVCKSILAVLETAFQDEE